MTSRPNLHGQLIERVSVRRFQHSARSNLQPYPKSLFFWWPIIEARARRHSMSAGPLLLNPIFRWAFLGSRSKLEAIESDLVSFEAAVASTGFQKFRDQLCDDLRGIEVENIAHNRLLPAWTEIRAVVRFSREGRTVSLVPRTPDHRTPDLRIDGRGDVEVKYIRPPDKLGEYVLRWWKAQKEVGGQLPQQLLPAPHLTFESQPIEARNELSASEIDRLRHFFTQVLLQPAEERSLSGCRISVSYRPERRLPILLIPLPEQALQSQSDREPLFEKIRAILNDAAEQVAGAEGRTLLLFVNLSPEINFLWPERFAVRMNTLREEFAQKGLDVLVDEVGYL